MYSASVHVLLFTPSPCQRILFRNISTLMTKVETTHVCQVNYFPCLGSACPALHGQVEPALGSPQLVFPG